MARTRITAHARYPPTAPVLGVGGREGGGEGPSASPSANSANQPANPQTGRLVCPKYAEAAPRASRAHRHGVRGLRNSWRAMTLAAHARAHPVHTLPCPDLHTSLQIALFPTVFHMFRAHGLGTLVFLRRPQGARPCVRASRSRLGGREGGGEERGWKRGGEERGGKREGGREGEKRGGKGGG